MTTITSKEGIKLKLRGRLLTMLTADKDGCRHEADLSRMIDGQRMPLKCMVHIVPDASAFERTDYAARRIGCCTFKAADWKLIFKAAKAGKQ